MSFREYMQTAQEAHRQGLRVGSVTGVRKALLRDKACAAALSVGQGGIKIVRRKAVFRDHDLAALFEWAADQLVVATPANIARVLAEGFVWSREHEDEVPIHTVLPTKLQSAYMRWLDLADGITSVRQWHDALEPEEMTFLPPEPWQVRS